MSTYDFADGQFPEKSIHTKPSNFSETTTGVLRVLNFLSAVGPRTSVRIKGELSVIPLH